MRLVGDHELVRVAADRAVVPREPGVRLDGDRVRQRRGLTLLHDRSQPVAVALRRELAVELRDQEAAMREDEDAHRARGLDEAGGRDRLPGRRRVTEPVAPHSTGVLRGRQLLGERLLVDDPEVLVLVLGVDGLGQPVPVHRVLVGPLICRDQLGEHSGQRVDLMSAQLGAGGQVRRLLREDALQAEHERVANLPLRGRLVPAGLDLSGRLVQRLSACRSGRQNLDGLLAVVQHRLADPVRRPCCRRDEFVSRRRLCSLLRRFLHVSGATGRVTSK